jgi:hypothetical protein
MNEVTPSMSERPDVGSFSGPPESPIQTWGDEDEGTVYWYRLLVAVTANCAPRSL